MEENVKENEAKAILGKKENEVSRLTKDELVSLISREVFNILEKKEKEFHKEEIAKGKKYIEKFSSLFDTLYQDSFSYHIKEKLEEEVDNFHYNIEVFSKSDNVVETK
jgi:hypothetical protein